MWLLEERYIELFFFGNKAEQIGNFFNIFIDLKSMVFPLNVGSILKNKEEDFAKDLHELSQEEEFNAMAFESLIDKIRTHVAEVIG